MGRKEIRKVVWWLWGGALLSCPMLTATGNSREALSKRPAIVDPESYLKPYGEFLSAHGREPHAFMMEALAQHTLVVMGEVHNRPTYWAFNRELVRDPAFAEVVGTIYLELPANHQRNIDAFLAAGTCQKDLVIQMLRDYHDGGWPNQSTLEFFVTVWEVNQKLPADKRLRLCLVDQQWPWEKIRTRADWRPYWVDRDSFMAENILKDRQTSADKRHGFFIVGMQHAMEGLYLGDQTTVRDCAGARLRQALGDQLFTVFQHAPVITNNNETRGRLALGLIDSALAQLQDRPVAFTLREGPFGKLPFDGMPDAKVYGSFRDGYDAYLYLTPLEDEILAPLIEGFYSDQFVREMDRRSRLMTGKPLFPDTNDPTGERMTRLWAESCGRPRSWIRDLGPENAWCYGDDWQAVTAREQERRVSRQELVVELDKVYRGLKELDPEKYSRASWERAFGFDYLTMADRDGMYRWWCAVIKEHPLESVEYGALSRTPSESPQVQVTTTLHGGVRFSKTFTFRYRAVQQRWQTLYGLDLHLDPQWKDFPKTHKIPSP